MAEFSSSAFSLMKEFRSLPVFKGKSASYFEIKFNRPEHRTPTSVALKSDMHTILMYIIQKRLNKKLKIKRPIYARESTEARTLKAARERMKDYNKSPVMMKVQVYLKDSHPRIKRFPKQFNDRFLDHKVKLLGNNYYITVSNLDSTTNQIKECLFNITWANLVDYRKDELVPKSLTKIRQEAEEVWEDSDAPSLQPKLGDKDPYVGIEVECLSKFNKENLIQHLVDRAPLLHKYVRIGYDGSIRTTDTYPHAFEFRILCKQSEVEKISTRFFEVLKGIIKVNGSCGLHVHLDMRNRNFGRSYERLYMSLPVLASMIPASRREGNTYCKLNNNKSGWQNPSDRYLAINPVSYRKYKTLEVRMHSATTNAKKVINWIKLLTLIVDKEFTVNKEGKSLEPQRTLSSLLSFFTKYEIPSDLRNYVTQRIAKFGKYKTLSIPKELEAIIPSNGTDVSVEQDEQDDTQNSVAV